MFLRKYLEHNPQTKNVYYVLRPQFLANDLGVNYTYQYFVIPFLDKEGMKLIEEGTRQMLYDRFGKIFVENNYVKYFLFNNNLFMTKYMNYISSRLESDYQHRLSRTTAIYLRKMKELCTEHNVELHVLPAPLMDALENYGWEDFEQDVKDYDLEDILGEFITRIHYYPKSWFRNGVHFKVSVLNKHLDKLRADTMNQ